jgi:ABC-type dipeptide/oligopeptide/nickel transport system permease subunit
VNYAWKRGAMLRHAYNYLLAPGFAIMALSLSFYFLSLFFEKKQEEINL